MKNRENKNKPEDRRTYGIFALAMVVIWGMAVLMLVYGYRRERDTVEVEEQKIVEISCAWWGNDSRHVYTMEGLDLFEERNPDIRVDRMYGVWNGYSDRMDVMMRSREEADVMLINYAWLEKYSADGTGFYDLGKLEDVVDMSNFEAPDRAFGVINGHLNALPTAYNASVALYNKDLYDDYGLALPESFDDWFAAAKVMREDGVYPVSMVEKQFWLVLAAWYEQRTGKTMFNPSGQFAVTLEEMEEILTFYKSLLDEKVTPSIDSAGNAFQSGKSAGIVCWISDVDRYAEGASGQGAQVKAVGIPQMKDAKAKGLYRKPATMFAVSSITRYPKEAGKLLDFLLNDPDMALLTGTERGIPVSKTALEVLEKSGDIDSLQIEANAVMTDSADDYRTMPQQMEDSDIMDCFKDGADLYLYERSTLEEAAQYILDGIQTIEKRE